MASWLRFHLTSGLDASGERLLDPALVSEMRSTQISHDAPKALAQQVGVESGAYGLGWHLYQYQGHSLAEHSGTLGGFRTHTIILADDGIAVTIMANLRRTNMVVAASRNVVDAILGATKIDWDEVYLSNEKMDKNANGVSHESLSLLADKDSKKSPNLIGYLGRFSEAAYGQLNVDAAGECLGIRWSSFSVLLYHMRDNLFVVLDNRENVESPLDGVTVEFLVDENLFATSVKFLGRMFVRHNHGRGS